MTLELLSELSVLCHTSWKSLKLALDHILFFDSDKDGGLVFKNSFEASDHLLIIDDFTNSGSTLFGAVNAAQKMVEGGKLNVSIFVSHLVALYDAKVVEGLLKKLHDLGPQCKFYTTNTIPKTTDLLKGDSHARVLDISDFIADLVH